MQAAWLSSTAVLANPVHAAWLVPAHGLCSQCLIQSQQLVVASRAPLASLRQVTWMLCVPSVLCEQTAMAAQPLTVLQELNKGIKIPSSCVGVERQGCQHGSAQVWPVDGPKHICHRQVVFM